MFQKFNNKEERRAFGGSAFIELQYCKMRKETKLKKLVAIRQIDNWHNDSLYVHLDDIEDFINFYSIIFNQGTYVDLDNGLISVFGVSYYSLQDIVNIKEKLVSKKPIDYHTLLKWLDNGLEFNGFYILGI